MTKKKKGLQISLVIKLTDSLALEGRDESNLPLWRLRKPLTGQGITMGNGEIKGADDIEDAAGKCFVSFQKRTPCILFGNT